MPRGDLRFLFDIPELFRTFWGLDIDPIVDDRLVLGLGTSDVFGPPDLALARVSVRRDLLSVGQSDAGVGQEAPA